MTRPTPRRLTPRRPLTLALFAAILSSVLLAAAAHARPDEFLDRANAAIRKVADDKRSDKVLLPLLPDMVRPPAAVKSQQDAALFSNRGPNWSECKAWAQAEPQTRVLAALASITRDGADPQRGFAFGLPYGDQAADEALVVKGMYVDLGDPPTLAAAKFLYLDSVENVGILAHIEASRLQEAGDPVAALGVIKSWAFFCRQMCDRPFLREKRFGMESLQLALERLADIAYLDFRAEKHNFQPSMLASVVGQLRDRSLYIDRIRLPEAEFIAREQLVSRVIIPKGEPDPRTFATTMARVAASDRPLKLFSTSAYWEQARGAHAGWYPSLAAISAMQSDWQKRWELSPFDVVQQRRTHYDLKVANRPNLAVVGLGMGGVQDLFSLRRRIDAVQAGARMGLAAYAYSLREKVLPDSLAACRPSLVKEIDVDPYSSTGKDVRYFIPVIGTPRDANKNERSPYTINIWLPDPLPHFRVPLDKTHFVIFSVGPDDRSQLAETCTQGRTGEGDFLLWPPPVSLLRQYLLDSGQLK